VVHRDVKASNVLLSAADDTGVQLGYFGLARLHDHGADPATTRVVGTLGYMSPEIVQSGRATTGTDVFAFGVLVLEVACGRRPINAVMGIHLVRWVRELGVKGELVRTVDERLEGRYDAEKAKLVLWLGLVFRCSQMGPDASLACGKFASICTASLRCKRKP
jgi:serine/threonine protein kinase